MMNRKLVALLSLLLGSTALIAQTETPKETPPDSLSAPGARLPIFSGTSGDLNADLGSQDVSGLLQSSKDIFTATAGYNFGNARFRLRGLGSENSVVLINGIRVNDLEQGWASWSNWGGLNDVTRNTEVHTGVSSSDQTFGGVAGYSNMDVRASNARKGTRISYAYSNRSYRHRLMVTHATGVLKNGWAFTVSGSRRYSKEGYVEGTFFDAWSFFLAAEKKLNDKHSIGIVGFGAPVTQGRQALATQETYDLSGSNYYNPNWGYQNGEKRNSRVSTTNKPMMMATEYWKINKKSKLETSLFFSKGKSNLTNLNWFEAKNPKPDYYRNLPSYHTLQNPAEANRLTNLWENDENFRQINWNDLYAANSKNLYTVENVNGVAGSNYTGNRSKYILENQIAETTISGLNALYNNKLNNSLTLSAGINYTMHKDHYYKTVNDLLGGEYWIDIDNLAERDFNSDTYAQNNIDEPNKIIRKDDIFGYNYDLHVNRSESFVQVEHKSAKVEAYGALMFSTTSFWREGIFGNARFPESSKGKSEVHKFFNYGIKGGLLYKLTGRHYLSSNFAVLTRAPLAREVFVSPRTRNEVVSNLKNENILSFDVNYIVRYAKFKSRATIYYNTIKNTTSLTTYYHDDYQTLVNYSMTGLDQTMMGIELGTEYSITPTITTTGVLAVGDYRYTSRPTATITRDNSTEILAENRTVYLKNFKIGSIPQTAASLGLKYSSPKFWFVGVNANYFTNINIDVNPDRRTVNAVANLVDRDPQWNQTLDQTQYNNQYTVDVYGGKSWKIKTYLLSWNVNINNVLNNRKFVTGGFEQLRYDNTNVDKFPPKLSYHLGLTFYSMLSLRF